MTPEDKAYYSDGYQPLFDLMSEEFGLTLLEQDMSEIMNCVRKMDEAALIDFIANPPSGWRFYEKEHYL